MPRVLPLLNTERFTAQDLVRLSSSKDRRVKAAAQRALDCLDARSDLDRVAFLLSIPLLGRVMPILMPALGVSGVLIGLTSIIMVTIALSAFPPALAGVLIACGVLLVIAGIIASVRGGHEEFQGDIAKKIARSDLELQRALRDLAAVVP